MPKPSLLRRARPTPRGKCSCKRPPRQCLAWPVCTLLDLCTNLSEELARGRLDLKLSSLRTFKRLENTLLMP
eukprot:6309448-Amphidinium_carterae.3